MKTEAIEVYAECTAARDGFCLQRDDKSHDKSVVQKRFDFIKDVKAWAEENGYIFNEYNEEGELVYTTPRSA